MKGSGGIPIARDVTAQSQACGESPAGTQQWIPAPKQGSKEKWMGMNKAMQRQRCYQVFALLFSVKVGGILLCSLVYIYCLLLFYSNKGKGK